MHCENQHGDVEHFAPKTCVTSLASPGIEDKGLVTGRIFEPVTAPGYYWLAYHWSNYLFCCTKCNTIWKANLFPVANEAGRSKPPNWRNQEVPLLLNPFNTDPADHLVFSALGSVAARNNSLLGSATIAVCGLWRPSLTQKRALYCNEALLLTEELVEALIGGIDLEIRKAARRVCAVGGVERIFAGAVRSVVTQKLGLSWSQIEKLKQ